MPQIAKFHAVVIENLPDLDPTTMQGWIQNPKAVSKVLEAFAPPRWRVDEDGTIRFSFTSTGETGAEWADWYKANGYDPSLEAEFMLRSSSFQPSVKGTVYEIAVLPGKFWEKDAERTTSNIRAKASQMKFKEGKELNPEVACLIRRMFPDEDMKAMGLWAIITLHEPISDSDGYPRLLSVWAPTTASCTPSTASPAAGGFAGSTSRALFRKLVLRPWGPSSFGLLDLSPWAPFTSWWMGSFFVKLKTVVGEYAGD